jgi:hypothetical protein
MASIVTKNVNPSVVPNPPAGKTSFGTTVNNEVFIKDEAGNVTILAGGATTLAQLTDVLLATLVNGQNLTYNNGDWINADPDKVFVSYPAAVNLSGQRMVRLDSAGELVYAENTDLADAERVLGMTVGAVNTGDIAQVIRSGVVVEPTWNWTLGQPIFLSTTGLLTQTPPAAGFVLQVAFPISSTSVFIDIKQALIL